jgi:hypothetical protein
VDVSALKSEMVSGLSKQIITHLLHDLRAIAKEKEDLQAEIERLKVLNHDLDEKLRMYRSQSVTIYQEPQREEHV